MAPRLASRLFAGALIRLATNAGGFGAILAKGDPDSGAVTILVAERGAPRFILERVVGPDGDYVWTEAGGAAAVGNDSDLARFLEKRRRIDPDMWLVELDVPSAERFADEIRTLG